MYTPLVPLLSLDPSSTKIGWALLGAGPTYLTSGVAYMPDAPPDERVRMVGSAVNRILEDLQGAGWPRPARALVELPDYIGEKARASPIILYFRAVGVAEYALHLAGLPVEYEKASKYKEHTRKSDAKRRFLEHIGRHPYTDDESDAFCIGWDFLVARPETPTPVMNDCDDPEAGDNTEPEPNWDPEHDAEPVENWSEGDVP